MATHPIYHYILLYQVYISRCFLFYEEHIIKLCSFLLICFLSVNLTSIIVLYNLTHISEILLSTECFLFCILLVCRCSIVLLYKIRFSMAARPYHYYIYPSQVYKLQFTAYCTRLGFGMKLQISFLVSISFLGNFTACLTTSLKLHHGSRQGQVPS